jgi:hypothetical protein
VVTFSDACCSGTNQVERQQDAIVREFQPEDLELDVENERTAQAARESNAKPYLIQYRQSPGKKFICTVVKRYSNKLWYCRLPIANC